jgi:hypothetical protein
MRQMGFFPTDVAAQLAPRLSIPPQEFDDGVAIEGEHHNRIGMQSAVANLSITFETANGDPTSQVTITLTVEHREDPTTAWLEYVEFEHVIAVADDDGAYTAMVVLPVNLLAAFQDIRLVAEVEHAGAGDFVVDEQFMAGHVVLGGIVEKPDALHENQGYAQVTAP